MEFTLEELYTKKEGQTYDRKSARKDPKGLSNHIVAFANADGGTLVIGIEDDFTVTGIDDYHNNVNDILRVPLITAPRQCVLLPRRLNVLTKTVIPIICWL